MNTIDIDVGGTFTDLVLNFEGKTIFKKAPTTPYDLSTCFLTVIEDGANDLDMESDELLPKIDLLRYSTTVAMNRLIERKGPRLGLITTEGHEDSVLIGKLAQALQELRSGWVIAALALNGLNQEAGHFFGRDLVLEEVLQLFQGVGNSLVVGHIPAERMRKRCNEHRRQKRVVALAVLRLGG